MSRPSLPIRSRPTGPPGLQRACVGLGGGRGVAPGARGISGRRRQRRSELDDSPIVRGMQMLLAEVRLDRGEGILPAPDDDHPRERQESGRDQKGAEDARGSANVEAHRSASHAEIARDDRHRQVVENTRRGIVVHRGTADVPPAGSQHDRAMLRDAIQGDTARALLIAGDDQSRFSPTIHRRADAYDERTRSAIDWPSAESCEK